MMCGYAYRKDACDGDSSGPAVVAGSTSGEDILVVVAKSALCKLSILKSAPIPLGSNLKYAHCRQKKTLLHATTSGHPITDEGPHPECF
jgi:hypothetical protein